MSQSIKVIVKMTVRSDSTMEIDEEEILDGLAEAIDGTDFTIATDSDDEDEEENVGFTASFDDVDVA